jgi:hypothetical protein
MIDIEQVIDRISKNVKCTESVLRSRMDSVLAENRAAWMDAGKSEDDCKVNALRIAGRQIKSEGDKLGRSGATLYEGMFISTPRFKDWAELAYKKAATTLANADESVMTQLVEQGHMTIYEDNNDGTYTKKYNSSLSRGDALDNSDMQETEVSSLPKDTYDAGNGVNFHLIWDNKSPKFPSGDANFKYGNPRPLSEKDRTCQFLGRKQGEKNLELWSFRFNGALAEAQPATFMAGTIAMRPAANGKVAYGKVGVSTFNQDDSLQSIFTDAPDVLVQGIEGIKTLEGGLQDIEAYVGGLNDKDKWTALVAVISEVIHIDPRDNGGYVVTVGDLDIMSTAGTVDIYVPASQEDLVDFAVGSTLLIVGQPYMTRDNEPSLVTTGWWCAESLGGQIDSSVDAEGWD